MRVPAAILFAGIFVTTVAIAQERLFPNFAEQGKQTVMHGQGIRSCGSFIENKQPYKLQNGMHYQDMGWVQGNLDGLDRWNPYDTKAYDFAGLDLWLEQYCRLNPLDSVANAAFQFYRYIGGRLPATRDVSIWRHFPITEQ